MIGLDRNNRSTATLDQGIYPSWFRAEHVLVHPRTLQAESDTFRWKMLDFIKREGETVFKIALITAAVILAFWQGLDWEAIWRL